MSNVTLLQKPVNTEDAIATLDSLREQIASGEVKAFIAVGITPDHETKAWTSATQKTSRLEIMGALAMLVTCYNTGEI